MAWIQLEWDFGDRAKGEEPVLPDLPYIADPKTDSDRLINLQYRYLRGDGTAWPELWQMSIKVAERIVRSVCRKRKIRPDADYLDDCTMNAVEYVLRRYKTRKGYFVRKNFFDALFQGVRHAMDYRTKADRIVDFVSIEDLDFIRSCQDDNCQ